MRPKNRPALVVALLFATLSLPTLAGPVEMGGDVHSFFLDNGQVNVRVDTRTNTLSATAGHITLFEKVAISDPAATTVLKESLTALSRTRSIQLTRPDG